MTNAYEYLESKGIRPSQQRLAIINYLLHNHTHPTADDIHTALLPEMPTLSKTTVYNTLKVLADNNAIKVITIDENNARYDACLGTHAHFKCSKCGCIVDIPVDGQQQDPLRNPNLAQYVISDVEVYYTGLCPECKKNNNN